MSEISSGKMNMAPKDEMAEKRTCPDLGFAQWPIGLNAQNDSKLQIGIRTNHNMINLDLKKVCRFTKVQVKDFFRSNKAWNSILRGFLDPKFHGEYESDNTYFWNDRIVVRHCFPTKISDIGVTEAGEVDGGVHGLVHSLLDIHRGDKQLVLTSLNLWHFKINS